jgi:hypothetical protein
LAIHRHSRQVIHTHIKHSTTVVLAAPTQTTSSLVVTEQNSTEIQG